MEKMIFGFVGEMASGKGTSCDYLVNAYKAGYHRYSTILRDVCDRLFLEQNRNNLQTLSTVLRRAFGQDLFAKVMAAEVNKDKAKIVCVDGIRRPQDIIYLKKMPNFILVNIFADMEKRYERIVKRAENVDDTQKTFERFKAEHKNENEVTIRKAAANADEKINNNGGFDELYKQLDELVKKYVDKN